MASKMPRIKKPKAENRVFLRKNFMKPSLAAIYYLSPLPLLVFKHAYFRSTRRMTSCKKTQANRGTQAFLQAFLQESRAIFFEPALYITVSRETAKNRKNPRFWMRGAKRLPCTT